MPQLSLLRVRVVEVATSVSHLGFKVLDQIHYVFKMKSLEIVMSSRVYKYQVYASRVSRIFCEFHIKLVIIVKFKKVLSAASLYLSLWGCVLFKG